MWYDLFVLAVLIYCTVSGAKRGVVWQLAGIAGLVLCVFFAGSFAAVVGPMINLEPPLNHWVTMFGAYLFFSFLSFSVARMLNGWIEKAQFKEFNQHLGAVLGFVKGAAFCLVLTFFVVTVSEPAREALKNSKSGHYAAIIVDTLHPVMPGKLHDALEIYIHQLDTPEMREKYAHEHAHGEHPHPEAGDDPFGLPTNLGAADSSSEIGRDPFTAPDPFAPETGAAGSGWSIPRSPNSRSSIPDGAAPSPPASLFDGLAAELPRLFGNDLGTSLQRSLQEMDPQTRQQVESRLTSAIRNTNPRDLPALRADLRHAYEGSANLFTVLNQWRNGTPSAAAQSSAGGSSHAPATPPSPPGVSAFPSTAQTRSQLLESISRQFSSFPQARKGIQDDIHRQLMGVPDAVALRVLDDWRADLQGTNPDPDSGTSVSASLDERIIRQLKAAGVPLDRLSGALQNRLSTEGAVPR